MPYTPPARSPATSGAASPAQFRIPSHMHQSSPPSSPGTPRPHLPRSATSTAYLQKSRRSPAFQVNGGNTPSDDYENNGLAIHSSLRQSPPPVTDKTIPSGAIISPPDSIHNSSDDEDGTMESRSNDLEQLSEAVRRHLDFSQEPASPTDDAPAVSKTLRLQVPHNADNEVALSPSARKISHSRSSTEGSFFDRRGSVTSMTTSEGEGSSDESDRPRPPLLRKKSGELVKPAIRPSSRRRHSSMPGTPTYSKAVHFRDDIEQVRHFLQIDRPIAVSAGTSPTEIYDDEVEFPFKQDKTGVVWEIRLANFPRSSYERISMPVRVEEITLSADGKSLDGKIVVANLAFQKWVVARFTLDYWKTTSEVFAEFDNETAASRPGEDGHDFFKFNIKVSDQANLETRTLLLCVRYNVNGQEYWDSNDGQNFQVDFIKKAKTVPEKPTVSTLGARPIPRSRHNSPSSARGRPPVTSFDDDFASGFESTSQLRFRNHAAPKPNISSTPPPVRRQNNASQQFGSRYDFGASLSAALSQAQAQLGDKSGIKSKHLNDSASSLPRERSSFPPSGASSLARSGFGTSAASGVESPRPEALLANKQTLDSRAYQDFVSKFCFFGSGKPSSSTTESKQPPNVGDGMQDDVEISPTTTFVRNVEALEMHKNGASNFKEERLTVPNYTNGSSRSPQGLSPSSSRSSSPTPSPGAEHSSQIQPSFSYAFHHDARSSMFSEPSAPTAIHG